jgi:ribosomal protein L11 methylase PrmA
VVVGGSVLAEVGMVGMVVVATVIAAPVDATDGVVETGGVGDVGLAAGVVAPGLHAAPSSTTATNNGFDLTCLPPPRTVLPRGFSDGAATLWEPGVVIVVVPTTEDGVAGVRARLGDLGVRAADVVAPSEARRLVLAAVDDEWEAECLAATLRAEGELAVTRPDGGARLEGWMRHTRPITFGERLSVCFVWSEHDRGGLSSLIELGVGGFGSGQHPSTRLLVEELLGRITGGERVLDVGCGSGVLGLCALKLGASCVVAVDIKADAIEATRRNAALNGMEARVDATLAPLADVDGAFGVVVANIGRAGIVELAPELVQLVAPGGWLAVSGISSSQCSLVAGFLRPLVELARRTSGEWSAVVLARTSTEDATRSSVVVTGSG